MGIKTLNKRIKELGGSKNPAVLKKIAGYKEQIKGLNTQIKTGTTSDKRYVSDAIDSVTGKKNGNKVVKFGALGTNTQIKKGVKKGPIVTKKQLEESGLSLRDYMNKQQGKVRKKGPVIPAKEQNLLRNTTISSNNKDKKVNSKDKKVNKKTTPMYSNDTANKKNPRGPKASVPGSMAGGPPQKQGTKKKKSLGSRFMGFLKGEGSKMKKDFNNAVSETKKNFGIAKKKKPVKKNNMDFGQKKKKEEAPMYESKGTMGGVKKMKMAKGYSKGGTVFTGR